MDQEIDHIYNLVVDLNYPITLSELRNPTSECMVKTVLTFLSGLLIDGKTIQKATFQQEQSLSFPEAHDEIISYVNLNEVMQKICKSVFIKDFYLVDMTSPGAKKARRLIFTLINFACYASNKIEELMGPVDEIASTLITVENHVVRKNQVMDARKEVVLENSKKTAQKEKILKQMEELKKREDQIHKLAAVVDDRTQNKKQMWQRAQQIKGSKKQQVLEINEKIAEIESTVVVESPEQYEAQLVNYTQDYADKKEKLEGMVERLRAKRELKSQFERVHEFVTQEYEKFSKVVEAHFQSKTLAETKVKLSKEYNEVQVALQNLQEKLENTANNNQFGEAEEDEIQAQCQEHIAPLLKSYKKYASIYNDTKNSFEETQIRIQQSRIATQESRKQILGLEEQIASFLKDCQDLYTSDIQKEVDTERLWKSKQNE